MPSSLRFGFENDGGPVSFPKKRRTMPKARRMSGGNLDELSSLAMAGRCVPLTDAGNLTGRKMGSAERISSVWRFRVLVRPWLLPFAKEGQSC